MRRRRREADSSPGIARGRDRLPTSRSGSSSTSTFAPDLDGVRSTPVEGRAVTHGTPAASRPSFCRPPESVTITRAWDEKRAEPCRGSRAARRAGRSPRARVGATAYARWAGKTTGSSSIRPRPSTIHADRSGRTRSARGGSIPPRRRCRARPRSARGCGHTHGRWAQGESASAITSPITSIRPPTRSYHAQRLGRARRPARSSSWATLSMPMRFRSSGIDRSPLPARPASDVPTGTPDTRCPPSRRRASSSCRRTRGQSGRSRSKRAATMPGRIASVYGPMMG